MADSPKDVQLIGDLVIEPDIELVIEVAIRNQILIVAVGDIRHIRSGKLIQHLARK